MKENFRKYFRTYLITFIASLVVGVTIFLVYFFVYNSTMYAAINGTSVAAVVLLSVGGLMWVANEGLFDVFSYGFKQLGSAMFGKIANQENDYPSYMEQNKLKREAKPKMFLSILASGVLLLIAMIVLRIVEACA